MSTPLFAPADQGPVSPIRVIHNAARVLSVGDVYAAPPSAAPYRVDIKRPTLDQLDAYNRARVTEGGWFVFWLDENCGWFRDFECRRCNAWRPGVVAISHNPADTRVWMAVGGDYQAGATRWQMITPTETGK